MTCTNHPQTANWKPNPSKPCLTETKPKYKEQGGMIKMEVTKEQFEAYEKVRSSGITNMFMIGTVCDLSGLSKETVLAIMKNYSELSEKYLEVLK